MIRSRSSKPNSAPVADVGVHARGVYTKSELFDGVARDDLPIAEPVDLPPKRQLPCVGKVPPLPPGYAAIVTSVFDLPDPKSVYEEVLAGIRPIVASRASMSELMDALDSAQAIALKARGLLVNTRATIDAVGRDTAVLVAAMRDHATAQLESEKNSGLRKKTITEADVANCLATSFPDEWRAVQDRESTDKRTIELIQDMCDRAVERARDLRAIVGASRSV